MLQVRVLWRYVCRDVPTFAATMTALLASACHSSEKSQAAITRLFMMAAFRLVRPPQVVSAQVCAASSRLGLSTLYVGLCIHAEPSAQSACKVAPG